MAELLPRVEIDPTGATDSAVVWLHGLGADGHDFEPIVPMLGLPRTRFVFPHAPAMPVTINGGMRMPAWYDIRTLSASDDREDLAHAETSARRIEALIAHEIARGVEASRIVLAGFSQGAAMALHVGLRGPHALAGIVALSGYLLDAGAHAQRMVAGRDTPLLICHGRHDDVVPIAGGRMAYEAIRAAAPQADVAWHELPLGHEVSPAEITLVAAWLRARIG